MVNTKRLKRTPGYRQLREAGYTEKEALKLLRSAEASPGSRFEVSGPAECEINNTLDGMFVWRVTPQGYDFWKALCWGQ